MPFLLKDRTSFSGTWKTLRAIVERELIQTRPHVYMAIHNDRDFSAEECKLVPNGLTYRAVPADAYASILQHQTSPWPYYMEESIHTPLSRDYFTRSLTGYVSLKMGRDLIFMDKHRSGRQLLAKAGSAAYDDPSVQTELARFYTNIGFYTEALGALKAASRFSTDSSELHSTWGYFYSKQGKFMEAIEAYRRSLKADPNASVTYRNLGVMFLQAGRKEAARNAFYKSLTLDTKQPKLRELIEAKGL
jgi:tetratricopeptide (TPR) repeat protein